MRILTSLVAGLHPSVAPTADWPEEVKACLRSTRCQEFRHEKSDMQFQAAGESQGTADQGILELGHLAPLSEMG